MSFCNFLLTCLTNPAKIKKKKSLVLLYLFACCFLELHFSLFTSQMEAPYT